jgi:hypothetical protein
MPMDEIIQVPQGETPEKKNKLVMSFKSTAQRMIKCFGLVELRIEAYERYLNDSCTVGITKLDLYR